MIVHISQIRRRPPVNTKAAEPCQRPSLAAGRQVGSPPGRLGTYPSRAGFIAAICVSWTITVVAGVFLFGGLS